MMLSNMLRKVLVQTVGAFMTRPAKMRGGNPVVPTLQFRHKTLLAALCWPGKRFHLRNPHRGGTNRSNHTAGPPRRPAMVNRYREDSRCRSVSIDGRVSLSALHQTQTPHSHSVPCSSQCSSSSAAATRRGCHASICAITVGWGA